MSFVLTTLVCPAAILCLNDSIRWPGIFNKASFYSKLKAPLVLPLHSVCLREHHVRHTAVGGRCVWEGVQCFHRRPALGAHRRRTFGAQASHRRERSMLGHRLRPPRISQHDPPWDAHPLQRGDLWKPGRHELADWRSRFLFIHPTKAEFAFEQGIPSIHPYLIPLVVD